MPHYKHDRETDLVTALRECAYLAFDTAAEAHHDTTTVHAYDEAAGEWKPIPADRLIVTFKLSDSEKYQWRQRECTRFTRREYIRPPWYLDPVWREAIERITAADDDDPRLAHYVHVSVNQPGKIAYTQNDSHGTADRQTVVRPGRYLAKYFSEAIDKTTIDRFCGMLTADRYALTVTKDPETIERVYTTEGFGSCMRYPFPSEYFRGSCHPVRAYGGNDSDLALAYVGDLAAGEVLARTVIWPDRQVYNRIFGHRDLMIPLLEAAGYSQGSIRGARITAIACKGGYVVPYVDNISSAELSRDRRSLVLGQGRVSVATTEGLSAAEEEEEEEELFSCTRCGYESHDSDNFDGDYCTSCFESMSYCEECEEYHHHDDRSSVESGDRYICDSCFSRLSVECDRSDCDREWIETDEFTREETAAREVRHAIGLCPDCNREYDGCPHCSEYTERGSTICDECGESTGRRCPDTADLPLTATTGDDDTTAGETAGERDGRS